jgi:starch synthase
MRIAFVASEVFPFAKTGGLADVAGALPKVLAKLGCDIKIFVPKYNSINETKFHFNFVESTNIPIRVAGTIRNTFLHKATLPGSDVEVNFIDCPYYFSRGLIYTNDADEDERFILFNKAVIEIIQRLDWSPDIIHCNDWQTGLIPFYIKNNYNRENKLKKTKIVFTIHNIGYQGVFPAGSFYKAEIDAESINNADPKPSDRFSFLKTGLLFSDTINTVSKTYAREIMTSEYGAGMETILKQKKGRLHGILNGIDYSVWNPLTDENIPFHFNIKNIEGKKRNKKYLLEKLNLRYDDTVPLIGIVSRMVKQKGFDVFAEAVNDLMEMDAQWIVLGNGEDQYEDLFRSLSHSHPDKVANYIGYNNELAHLIEAGADIFLMPSHYEPCGLNQLYSLRYGTVPIVRKTGGLADTVKDWNKNKSSNGESGTGFSFESYSARALLATVKRAMDVFQNKNVWQKIQGNGMLQDFSWERSGKDYIKLYQSILNKKT